MITQKRRVPLLLLFLSLVVVLGVLTVKPALAGCCLVLSVDELPDSIMAGKPVTLSYTARRITGQGQQPLQFQATVTAVHAATHERVTVEAVPIDGEPGRFQATLVFPTAGLWQWQIGNRAMPPLQVQEASFVAEGIPANPPPLLPVHEIPLVVGILGLSTTAAGLVAWLRRRSPNRLAFVVLAALITLGALAMRAAVPRTAVAGSETTSAAIQPEDMGEALFLAKGCLSCHRHDGLTLIDGSGAGGIAPDLTHYRGDPEFLRRWLSDPKAIRPTTFMPNLELDEHEIEALVEFLSS